MGHGPGSSCAQGGSRGLRQLWVTGCPATFPALLIRPGPWEERPVLLVPRWRPAEPGPSQDLDPRPEEGGWLHPAGRARSRGGAQLVQRASPLSVGPPPGDSRVPSGHGLAQPEATAGPFDFHVRGW